MQVGDIARQDCGFQLLRQLEYFRDRNASVEAGKAAVMTAFFTVGRGYLGNALKLFLTNGLRTCNKFATRFT